MKIRKLQIHDIDYKPLMNGLDLYFPKTENDYTHANCFIGINGSGKSQVLEIIAEIFFFLDRVYRIENKGKDVISPFAFTIEYELNIESYEYLVIVSCDKIGTKSKDINIDVLKNNVDDFIFDIKDIYNYLPNKIIGYTSGANETLSLPFDSYYDEYADWTALRAKEFVENGITNKNDYEPKLYFMNYNTNLGIAISSLIFEDDILGIEIIKQILNIEKLERFTITLQIKPQKYKIRGGIQLTEELQSWKDKLIKCSTTQDYIEEYDCWKLEYVIDKVTIAAFKSHFSNALELYTCLYKFELLNNLIVDKNVRTKIKKERKGRNLVTKMPMISDNEKILCYSELDLKLINNTNPVKYLSLSDGEHQFLNVFGTILMINQDNCLFLLDEPETHFNPLWRRTFISTLKKITKNRKQDLIITTHSPFVVSDSKKENVFIFKRENNKITISDPKNETYGASFDEILDMAFDISIPISEDSLKELKVLEKETNPNTISDKLLLFGDSLEKASLLNRIILLNSKKK